MKIFYCHEFVLPLPPGAPLPDGEGHKPGQLSVSAEGLARRDGLVFDAAESVGAGIAETRRAPTTAVS